MVDFIDGKNSRVRVGRVSPKLGAALVIVLLLVSCNQGDNTASQEPPAPAGETDQRTGNKAFPDALELPDDTLTGAAEDLLFVRKPSGPSLDCDGSARKPLRDIPAGGIVKWTDENGIIHYEDYQGALAPEGLQVVTRFPDTKQYFSLNIETVSGTLKASFRADITQKAIWIYEFYRTVLDERLLSRAEVSLVIHGRNADYETVRNLYVGGGSENVSGFYIVSRNRAEILRQETDELTMKVVVHEVVHVVNNQLFGQLPRWLNEGLATYIESLDTDQQRSLTAKERLKVIKKQVGLPLLGKVDTRQLLATDKQPWPPEKRAGYYQFSQLLTAFLFQSENRGFSQPFLNELAAQKCGSLDVADYIGVHYKGGISGLEGDFRRWLRK